MIKRTAKERHIGEGSEPSSCRDLVLRKALLTPRWDAELSAKLGVAFSRRDEKQGRDLPVSGDSLAEPATTPLGG